MANRINNKICTLVKLIVLLSAVNGYATNCILKEESDYTFIQSFPLMLTDSIKWDTIVFSAYEGDKRFVFNFNYLYKISMYGKVYSFRFNYREFNNQTILRGVQWENNKVPPTAGTYYIEAYTAKKTPIYNKTMATIGDSITWSLYGSYMRCLLIDNGLPYDFIGTKTDTFGFPHEGEGGNNTFDALNRVEKIPYADSYFLLIGTNDINYTANQTVENIATIADKLLEKNPNALIYISTLLPREDYLNERNLQVNALLKNKKWSSNIKILDVGGDFYANENWESLLLDGIHPNFKGYNVISQSIIKQLKGA